MKLVLFWRLLLISEDSFLEKRNSSTNRDFKYKYRKSGSEPFTISKKKISILSQRQITNVSLTHNFFPLDIPCIASVIAKQTLY